MNERLASAKERRFVESVMANEFVAALAERMRGSDLPEWYLSGGCLFQTFWNVEHGFNPSAGILDYDLFYFDRADLSAHAERAIGERVSKTHADLRVRIEARNQARVHLWYEEEFGASCRQFERCEDGIDGFLATCCCFGMRLSADGLDVYAPYGFDDLFDLVVRPNPARTVDSGALSDVYASKVRRWARVWPQLAVVPWPGLAA